MTSSPDTFELLTRLIAAVVLGSVFGLNRDLRGKPIGMRTLALVCLGAAALALSVMQLRSIASSPVALGRVLAGVIQGSLTGIGFVGAGVILKHASRGVENLTTATTVWLTTVLGLVCAIASWLTIFWVAGSALAVLTLGRPVERYVNRRFGLEEEETKSRDQ